MLKWPLLDSVNSDEEDDLDNMICDSDTYFECVDASAVEIADLSVNKFRENWMEKENEYSLEAVVKKPRIEIPELTSSSNSMMIRGQNPFSSVSLYCTLKERGIFYTGTVQKKRRGLPDFIADKQMKRGDIECYVEVKEGIATIKWMDNRSVHIITTADSCHLTTTVKKQQKGTSEKLSVVCPEIIKTYSYNMVAVDKSDQMIVTRNWDRKAPGKFYLRLHFDYLEQAMVNAKIAYEANVQPGISAKHFRMTLLDLLISVKGRPH